MKQTTKTYLALGDSMSIDLYTGVAGGGAVSQLYQRLQARNGVAWRMIDETYDGCVMAGVPLTHRPGGLDLITVTIAGNDLLQNIDRPPEEFLPGFRQSYCRFLGRLQKLARNASWEHPDAIVIVGNIYRPDGLPGFSQALDASLRHVNQFIGEKVRNYGFRLADIHGAFLGHESRYLCRSIEPTLEGATVIADLFEQHCN